jgi:hypothetical protein
MQKVGDRWVAANEDGTPHRCKGWINNPSTEKAPALIGRLDSYTPFSVTFTMQTGKVTYAQSRERAAEMDKAAFLMPKDNHPDVWLSFAVDKQGFLLPGYKQIPKPDWVIAEKTETVNPGKQILQENLDAKLAETKKADAALNTINAEETPKTPTEPVQKVSDEDRIQAAMMQIMPSERVGYRISLAGMVNSVIEMKKISTDAPKNYAELEAEVKRDAVRLFIWCDNLTTKNIKEVK